MVKIPQKIKVWHKIRTPEWKWKVIKIKWDIADILVWQKVFEQQYKDLEHIKTKKKPLIDDQYIANNSGRLLDEHLNKLNQIDFSNHKDVFQWVFTSIIKWLNFVNFEHFEWENFWSNLALNLEERLSIKLKDQNFKIWSYAWLPIKEYEDPEISLKWILGQFLRSMQKASTIKKYSAEEQMRQTLQIWDVYCNRHIKKFFSKQYESGWVMITNINLN